MANLTYQETTTMQNKDHSLWLIVVIGAGVIALLAASLMLTQRNVAALTQQALDLQGEIAQRVSTDVASLINGRVTEMTMLIKTQNLMQLQKDDQRNTLSALLAAQSAYEELAILNSEGQEIVRVAGLSVIADVELNNWATRAEFEEAKAFGQVYYSPMQFDEISGEPFMIISVPSYDTQRGGFDGVLMGRIRFRSIWDMMSGARAAGNSIVYMVDGENRVVAHRDPAIVLQGTRFELPGKNGFSSGLEGDTAAMGISLQQFGGQQFRIVAEQQSNEALSLAETDTLLTAIIILVLLIMIATVIVTYKKTGKA